MKIYNDYRDAFKTQSEILDINTLEIQGVIPKWLNGAFISTGPGQFEIAGKHAKHWFDGYAMLKGFYFSNGNLAFRNRMVYSDTYLQKEFLNNHSTLPNEASKYAEKRLDYLKTHEAIHNNPIVNVCQLAETGIAMTEVPSQSTFDIKSLDTTGHLQYEHSFTSHFELAHPTFDPITKSYINLAVEFGKQNKYLFYQFDIGTKTKKLLASYESEIPFYIHSFSVTENHFILFFSPLILDLSNPDANFLDLLKYQEGLNSRLVVINRSTKASQVFETDAFICFHQANAYEQKQEVILDLCCYQAQLSYETLYFDAIMKKVVEQPIYLTRFHLNLATGHLSKQRVCEKSCEFPRLNTQSFSGKIYNYNYLALSSTEGDFLYGLMKIDMSNGANQLWQESNCYCGEPIFVPKPNATSEDDGVILSIIFDANKQTSFLLILDGKTFSEVARAYLPTFMPVGLHGDWFNL